jgi:predicted RNA-binding Zn-ribbon protein involved in translation (DUF1610 family)
MDIDISQPRRCKKCGYKVIHHWICDVHGNHVLNEFVATQTKGDLKGLPMTATHCPNCGNELTIESTRKVPVRKDKKKDKPDNPEPSR